MQHLDEGKIHAWLDGELPSPEREALEAHVAQCAQCAAAVAEARGFIAASTRILTALDSVPGGVLPAASTGSGMARPAVRRRFVVSRAWMAAAAVLVLSTVTVIATRPENEGTIAKLERPQSVAYRLDSSPIAPQRAPADTVAAPAATSEKKVQDVVTTSAPAPMQSRTVAPDDKPKPVDQTERLKKRLQAERQSTRMRTSNGAPPAMANVVPATPPAAVADAAKDAADQRAEPGGSLSDSIRVRGLVANAQEVSITGRVTSEAGAPLASASVVLEGTGIGTITHDDGSYALVVPPSRANGQTKSLVARLIGYKSVVAPLALDSESITHDFVLGANPLVLNEVVVTGLGTTSPVTKLGSAIAGKSASTDSAAPKLLSRKTTHVDGDTVVTTVYSVRGVHVSLIDQSSVRDEAGRLQQKSAANEMSAQSSYAPAATNRASVNSISWSDSTGHTRTLRGPLTPEQLAQLKKTLFGATP